jgi:hypothetical protein
MHAMRAVLLSLALLAGCSSNTAWKASFGQPLPDANVQVSTGSDLAAAFGLVLIAGGLYAAYADEGDYWYSRKPPEMAPDRRVSEQDCTRPLDLTKGNIRCK